jgi:pimeloyl-ACP methyl ester carboxylesterase
MLDLQNNTENGTDCKASSAVPAGLCWLRSRTRPAPERLRDYPAQMSDVRIPPHDLPGTLILPAMPQAVVAFAHGSGSGRFSPRNRQVAALLQQENLGTLLFDLLSDAEAGDRRNVFDIPLLAQRLGEAIDFLRAHAATRTLPIGLFGASTGAAAALVAAAQRHAQVSAVVSRGGRPDLAGGALPMVRAPTLLIVGGADVEVLMLNRAAARQLACEHELAVVPHATHLFEEPGALEQVQELAAKWFGRHCRPAA